MLSPFMGYLYTDEIYLAGERAPAGTYREVGTGREVMLEQSGLLPAAEDGHMTAYVCVQYAWYTRR